MGSLSYFIDEQSVKQQLDEAFRKAEESQSWDDYFDDCHFYLIKASQDTAKLSHSGALTIVQYYYDNVIKTSEDETTVYKALHMLEQILSLCCEHKAAEDSDWFALLVASPLIAGCFIPALQHEQVQVQQFGMEQIAKCVKSSARSALIQCEGLLSAVLRLLGSGVNKVSAVAKTALVDLCHTDDGLAAVFMDGSKLDVMTEVAARSDSAKFNIYELVQRVCVLGGDHLSVVSNSGWLDRLVAEVSSSDTLSQLAALQLVCDLMQDGRSLQHLSTAGVLHKLQKSLVDAHTKQDTLLAMNIPGLLKVFGAVGRTRPELVCGEHSEVVTLMLHYSCGSGVDPCLSLIALETLAMLAATHRAKTSLHYCFKTPLQQCLKALGEQLHSAPMETRARILASLVLLFDVVDAPSDRQESDEVGDLLQLWYGATFPCGTLAPIDRFMRLPFPEIHLETYRLMLAFLKQPWGAQLISASGVTLKYLVDRSTESNKEGKELKFELVSALVRQKQVLRDTAGEHATDLLLDYCKKGAFYVLPFMDVGMEEMQR